MGWVPYYETISGVRQGVPNLLAVGLHHLFEQQQLFFLRRELARGEEGALQAAELARGWQDRASLPEFSLCRQAYELKQAANAIKHGAGPSARKPATLRPDLFEHLVLASHGQAKAGVSGSDPAAALASLLFAPLAGSDLYVSERDLSDWCTAVIA